MGKFGWGESSAEVLSSLGVPFRELPVGAETHQLNPRAPSGLSNGSESHRAGGRGVSHQRGATCSNHQAALRTGGRSGGGGGTERERERGGTSGTPRLHWGLGRGNHIAAIGLIT